jgi:NitT/TauT family transport system ATP-binding protein
MRFFGATGCIATLSRILVRVETRTAAAKILEARRTGLRFPSGTQALQGLDLVVGEGEFVSLVGPSGCGKSSLLRLVAGLLNPSEGALTVGGLAPIQARRTSHSCGFVFQAPTLLPWRSVRDNLLLPLELEGCPAADRRVRAAAWLERVGLADFADAWPAQLSGGMRMRVSIARALASRPRILLMDEPFAALDDITRGRLQEDLLDLRREFGFTTVFVTHNVSEAVFLSDRVAVMSARPGRVVGEVEVDFGTTRDADLRGEPAFAAKVREVGRLLRGVGA